MASSRRRTSCRRLRSAAWLAAAAVLSWSGPALAASAQPGATAESGPTPIQVTSDRLTLENDRNIAEFSGNVRAIQGATEIFAENLRVHYRNEEGGRPSDSGQIERIVARGGVVIHFENRVAEGTEAIYNAGDRVLVLTGPEAKIRSGKSSVTGERITLHRDDGRVTVESGGSRRVEALFFTDEKGLE